MLSIVAFGLLAVQKPVYDIEVSPDDRWMAVTNATDRIWIYSVPDAKLLHTLKHKPGSHLVDVEIAPDGKSLVCSNTDFNGGYAPVWSTSTWQEIGKIAVWMTKGFADSPNGIEFAGHGKYVVGLTLLGRSLVCWNYPSGTVAYIARKKPQSTWMGLAVNKDSTLALLREPSVDFLRFWDFEQNPKSRQWGATITGIPTQRVKQMRFNHANTRLFLSAEPKPNVCDLIVCRPKLGRTVVTSTDRIDRLTVRDCAWAGDDSVIWVGGLKGQMACFDPSTSRLRCHWTAHDGAPVRAVAALNRTHTVVTGGGSNISLWEGDTGKLIRTIQLPVE